MAGQATAGRDGDVNDKTGSFRNSAYGGDGWSPRTRPLADEIGDIWAASGIDNEWNTLRAVVLHAPGEELAASAGDANAVQMLEPVDAGRARAEHDAMAGALRANGVAIHAVDPAGPARPNQMFCADLRFMTPEGAVLARPASTVRAGEEREIARRLAHIGVPILLSLRGTATFEGADAMWLGPDMVVMGRGLRTNPEGIEQVASLLWDMQVETLAVDMPYGTMHLMGMLRFADRDLAICWRRVTPHAVVTALRERGYEVAFLPDGDVQAANRGLNFVTLGPRRILMIAGYGEVQAFYEDLGIDCVTVEASELVKAAGGFGCLTGVLQRDPA